MRIVFHLLFFLGLASPLLAAPATEMIVLEQPGCPWCKQFNEEIAPAWPNTPEGHVAPLRRVDITEPWPEDLAAVQRERFTPSFILMHGGKEIGRLRGYVGDQFFWFRIAELIAELPQQPIAASEEHDERGIPE